MPDQQTTDQLEPQLEQPTPRPASSWPPPPTERAPWRTRLAVVGRARDGLPIREEETVREVPLWGRRVLINETEDAVWCSDCRRWIPLEELQAAPYTGHRFDGRPRRGTWPIVDEPNYTPRRTGSLW